MADQRQLLDWFVDHVGAVVNVEIGYDDPEPVGANDHEVLGVLTVYGLTVGEVQSRYDGEHERKVATVPLGVGGASGVLAVPLARIERMIVDSQGVVFYAGGVRTVVRTTERASEE